MRLQEGHGLDTTCKLYMQAITRRAGIISHTSMFVIFFIAIA